MIKYVPEYIFQKYEEGVYQGYFQGYALFFDIKDFTRITESLTRKGQKGAEVINKILEDAFSPVIRAIESQGGFVTGFAGDAFMAVFDQVSGDRILSVYQIIKESLATAPVLPEVGEDFRIDARLTVCFGEIRWIILKNEYQNEYFFYGSAIEECNAFADLKQDVIFSEAAAEDIGIDNFLVRNEVNVPLDNNYKIMRARRRKYVYTKQTVQSFLNKFLQDYRAENEIRDISNAFIYLDKIEFEQLNDVIGQIEMLAGKYYAFFNKLDYSDKGLLGILIFGAPRKYEKTLNRMMYFVAELMCISTDIKLGISSGRVYAGFTGTPECQEYTILGYPPNLASRLMMKAKLGETLVDVFSYEQLLNRYNFSPLGNISMKGFASELPVYRYEGEKQNAEDSGLGVFCGRKEELATILSSLKREISLEEIEEPGFEIIYIHGDPGMGKSRLVKEVRRSLYPDEVEWCCLLCDGILKQPYSPVIKYLKEYFHYNQKLSIEDNKSRFSSIWEELTGEDLEMARIESLIGQLLGYRWQGSIWELLPPAARPLQERKALVTFFLKLAETRKVVIHLEDGQWIDSETLEMMQALCAEGSRQIIILYCCRSSETGKIIQQDFPEAREEHLHLQPLSESAATELVLQIVDLAELPEKTEELILQKGQGNPLFLEQTALYLQEQDYLDAAGNLKKDVEMVTAFGITDIIGARIDNLTEQIRKLVYYASVLGVEFDIPVLSYMIDHKLEEETDEVVQNCIWIRLKELHFIFAQILFRDTAYNRLLEEKKKQLNLLAAESYEKIYNKEEIRPYYEMIGLHYERAEMLKGAYASYAAAFFVAYRDMRLKKALELAWKSLKIKEKVLEPDDILIAQSYNCLGLVYHAMGKYHKSLKYTLQALPIFEEKNAKFQLIIALLNNAGNAYSLLGEYDKALEYHGKSLLIRSIELGEKHPDFAKSVMHMGNVYLHMDKNEEALEHYERALKILLECEEEVPGKLVMCYSNMGSFYSQNNQFEEALHYLEKALPILSEHDSLDKPGAAALYRQIGNAWWGMKNQRLALENLNKSLEILERIYGKNHPETATTYDYIGRAYSVGEENEKAIYYLNKAMKIYQENFGIEHIATAHLFFTLGECYFQMSDYQSAKENLKMSQKILKKTAADGELIKEVESYLAKIRKSIK
ncbi:MAG: tetratricopeptide repeat protein [Candidatus Cloacimonetes bacterium]|nr:tetratricopeptide repeat protein [Candidatus Cloacimonadota bacterium]